MRRPARVAALLAGLVLAASCDGSPRPVASPSPPVSSSLERSGRPDEQPAQRYVALGDSFTAAPLVPVTHVADGCFRSDGNYPSLLAARLQLDLTDVSCSGATTLDLVQWQRTVQDTSVPPQLRAVDRSTDLVTIGIGGNDLGLFGTLVQTCLGLRAQDPDGAPCADSAAGRRLLASTPRIGDNVQRALERVQQKAPQARVVLVGYPRIAPPAGTCPQLLPFATGDVAFGDDVLRAVDAAMSRAAESAGVDYLDLYEASAGHDACSAEPWVNGRRTEPGVAVAYHPLAAGAEATATLLEELLAAD